MVRRLKCSVTLGCMIFALVEYFGFLCSQCDSCVFVQVSVEGREPEQTEQRMDATADQVLSTLLSELYAQYSLLVWCVDSSAPSRWVI